MPVDTHSLRSSRVMTTERCLIRALLIMSPIWAVCSRIGVKPFCTLCSTKLLDARKEYTAFRRQDVNTFKGTDSSVMGRKFEGSLLLPFLWISMVHALFYSVGTVPGSLIS